MPSTKARTRRTKNRRGEAPEGAPAYVTGRRSRPLTGSAPTARRAKRCGVPHRRLSALHHPLIFEGTGMKANPAPFQTIRAMTLAFAIAVISVAVPELQHSDSFGCRQPESPKFAAFADALPLPAILGLLLNFCDRRPRCDGRTPLQPVR